MMIFAGNFAELGKIHQRGKLVKVKHRRVFTMLAVKRYVLAEIHIL